MKKIMGTFLIIAGVVLIIIGIKVCTTKNIATQNTANQQFTTNNSNPAQQSTVAPEKEEVLTESKQKGNAFEKYIESIILSNNQFTCVDHRRYEKVTSGKLPESSKYPDYDFARKEGNKKIMFSIECVVRKNFFKGNIDWAKDYQIKNWNNFQKQKGWPVFVIIGIVGNGTYDQPEDVFMLPLERAQEPQLSKSYLANYKLIDIKNDIISILQQIKNSEQAQSFNINERNGFDFEIYLRDRITQNKNIICVNHQSDIKSTSGILPEASKNPDFDFALQLGKNRFPFSVECKVRKNFDDNDTVMWAKDYQINNYNNYQQEKNWPVFVAVGVVENGTYKNPEHLYILPLNSAQESFLSREYLSRFEIKKERDLYFDIKTQTLS